MLVENVDFDELSLSTLPRSLTRMPFVGQLPPVISGVAIKPMAEAVMFGDHPLTITLKDVGYQFIMDGFVRILISENQSRKLRKLLKAIDDVVFGEEESFDVKFGPGVRISQTIKSKSHPSQGIANVQLNLGLYSRDDAHEQKFPRFGLVELKHLQGFK